eukprot:TRINITY_DN3691_c0_g1_i1.p1 TRINITY_DN3691_c0_g1~~TRINITY_DN3691_c0_g1_i1.p1  ORF type:complete len:484 (+),score=109.44 TRINITY_DN3691_c0_g1_i1:335-1786(+)
MLKDKNWVILEFDTPHNAELAHQEHHFSLSTWEKVPLIMLLYCVHAPPPEKVCNLEDISGIKFVKDWITEEEEHQLMDSVYQEWDQYDILKRRRVKHWGYAFDYKLNILTKQKIEELPEYCHVYIQRLYEQELIPHIPDQLTVNVYEPGAGIPAHVDNHTSFEDGIIIISMGSQLVMDLKKNGKTQSLLLEPRSLLVLTGDARYNWTHAINSRKSDLYKNRLIPRGLRISLTMRKMRMEEGCDCRSPELCDWWLEKKIGPVYDSTRIENVFVNEAYGYIYESGLYQDTVIPKIMDFIEELPMGTLLCDIGCGQGSYANVNRNIIYNGCDFNTTVVNNLINEPITKANILNLPYRDNYFDVVLCLGVLDHLSNEMHRYSAIREIYRIAKPNGIVIMNVYAMEQDHVKFSNQNNMIKLPVSTIEDNEILSSFITNKDEQENVPVFFHTYRHKELEQIVDIHANTTFIESFRDKERWNLIARKDEE